MTMRDEEIYLRYIAKENDEDLETLLIRYRDGLYLFLLGMVKNEEDAEDLLMDTFAKLAVDKPHFDPDCKGSFKSWLYAIARNNALMHIRKRKLQIVTLSEEIVSDEDTPESEMLKNERNRSIYRALMTLKPEYRQALSLLYIDGLSHEEIAVAMGMKKKQIYHLVDRGKTSLKKAFERMGIEDAQY